MKKAPHHSLSPEEQPVRTIVVLATFIFLGFAAEGGGGLAGVCHSVKLSEFGVYGFRFRVEG